MHGFEQFAADRAQARLSRWHDRHSAHEERGLHHVELKALRAAPLKRSRNIRILHESVISHHGMEIVAKVDDLDAPVRGDARYPAGDDVQQHDALVQHLIVLEIVQQAHRHERVAARQVDRRARHAVRRMREQALQERRERNRRVAVVTLQQRGDTLPDVILRHGVAKNAAAGMRVPCTITAPSCSGEPGWNMASSKS